MTEPFLGEIRIMSFGFAPRGWALANGQLLPIAQNQALFALLGNTYGGNGQTTFALPDLRSRTPIHFGAGHALGERAGSESVTLLPSQMPLHMHALSASSAPGDTPLPPGNQLASPLNQSYRAPGGLETTLAPETIANVGGSQPHTNKQPYLALNFCIALAGIFPSQS
jgi:microcystin-dependent protein